MTPLVQIFYLIKVSNLNQSTVTFLIVLVADTLRLYFGGKHDMVFAQPFHMEQAVCLLSHNFAFLSN